MINKNWWQSIIFIGLLINSASICEAKEKYVRKELISFTWGNGKYQLGSNWRKFLNENGKYIGPEDARSHAIGPSAIRVDKKGRIFIWDPQNNRILIFNKNGTFLREFNPPWLSTIVDFDKQNNLYMVIDTMPLLCQKYNPGLKLIKEFYCESPMTKKHNFGRPQKLLLDKNGNLNFVTTNRNMFQVDLKAKKVEKVIMKRKFRYMPIKSYSKTIRLLKQKEKKLQFVSPRTLEEKTISLNLDKKLGWVYEVIGEDRAGNIFLLMNISETLGEKGKEVVQKYAPKGEFIVEICIYQDDRLFATQEEGGRFHDVDDDGNVYHLWIQKEGAKLIKWEKV